MMMICRRFLISSLSYCRQLPLLKQTPYYVSVNKISVLQSTVESVCAKYDDNPNFKSLLSVVNSYGIDKNYLVEAIDNNPNVLSIDPNRMNEIANQLIQFGFNADQLANVFYHYPEICSTPTEQLNDSLLLWSQMKFSDGLLFRILNTHPKLIDKLDSNCSERVRLLLPYLENTKNVGNAILGCPSILFEGWETLKAKLDYLNSINIMSEKIAKGGGLGLTLNHIKTRFEFLRRAGVYKDLELKKKLLNKSNPKIENILSTSDEEFARNVARLSLAELETFTELYERELEKEDYGDRYDPE